MENLPKQVQQSVQELEEYERQLLQKNRQSEEPEPEEPEPEEPEPEEPQSETQPETKPDPQPESDEKWEQKYKVLQGKYNAEVPRLHHELKELRNAFQEMQQAQQQPEKKPEPPQTKFVTDEDRDNFGEDLIEVQRRVAREVVAELNNELESLKRENQALKQQFGQVHTDNFQTRLLQAVPDFQQVDQDPRWIAWLDEVDPLLRGPRRAIATQAWQQGDVDAIKSYIDLWRQSTGESNKPARQDRTNELRKQVQPTRASAPANSTSQQGKVYTDAEARRAFDKIQKLISTGKYDEADTLEKEISAAYVEGRIRP